MSEGTILKRYIKDGEEHAIVMLNIRVVYLTLLNNFLDSVAMAEETLAKAENHERPKTLSIHVSEAVGSKGKFG